MPDGGFGCGGDLVGFVSAGSDIPTPEVIRVQVPLRDCPAHWTTLILQACPDGHMASYLQSHAAAAGSGDCVKPNATNGNPKANTRSIGILLSSGVCLTV